VNLRKIKQLLEDTFNVQVEIDSRPTEDGLEISIKPSGINRASNFVTVFLLAWRSISFEFGLGSYAKDSIIYAIKNADNQKKSLFNSMCSEISENQGSLIISLDEAQYERSPKNRKDCIAYHGLDCKVCRMNFKDIYGELGENFIHVHHIVPLSEMENSYKLDPREDLVPLCPNCHAMVHRHDPVLLPDELKEILRQEDS
jgi:predicted HNH restriction endonuclease